MDTRDFANAHVNDRFVPALDDCHANGLSFAKMQAMKIFKQLVTILDVHFDSPYATWHISSRNNDRYEPCPNPTEKVKGS